MPSVLPSRDVLALESWRDPNQLQPNRPYSTGYNIKFWEEGSEILVLDYEKNSRPLGFDSSLSSIGRNPQSHVLLTSSSNKSRYPNYPISLRRTDSQHQRGKHTSTLKMPKRRAEISPGPPPANRRPRQLSTFNPTPSLRDVSYIRSDMKVPTREDYPAAPPSLFSQPKSVLHNVLQKFAGFESSTAEIGTPEDRVFQCKVSCPKFDGSKDIITLIGEGRSKVDSSSPQSLQNLTLC